MTAPSLTRHQHKKWLSRLVRVLQILRLATTPRKEYVISILEILWLMDFNPSQTFAEGRQQLHVLREDAGFQDVCPQLDALLLTC